MRCARVVHDIDRNLFMGKKRQMMRLEIMLAMSTFFLARPTQAVGGVSGLEIELFW